MGERKLKRAKPARSGKGEAFGIVNPYGNLWTWSAFTTERAARKYLVDFWKGIYGEAELSKFKIIPVKVTVSDARSLPTPDEQRASMEQGHGV